MERAEKIGDIWKLTLRKVVDEGEDRVREDYWIEVSLEVEMNEEKADG